MKTHVYTLIAFLSFIGLNAAAQPYYVTVNGQLANNNGSQIGVELVDSSGFTEDSIVTDVTGAFVHTMLVEQTAGVIIVYFPDCYGEWNSQQLYYTAGGTVDFNADYCPPVVLGPVTVDVYLENTGGLPVDIALSWANGSITGLQNLTTNASGNLTFVITGLPDTGSLTVQLLYTNCYGGLQAPSHSVQGGLPAVNFYEDYCVPIQQLPVSGHLMSTGGVPVAIGVYENGELALEVTTDANGNFADTIETFNTDGVVYFQFVNCNGDSTFSNGFTFYIPDTMLIVYNADFCPPPTLQSITVQGQLYGVNAFLVNVTATTDYAGPYTAAVGSLGTFNLGAQISNITSPIVMSFTDCYGTLQFDTIYVTPGTAVAYYEAVYCNAAQLVSIDGLLSNASSDTIPITITTDSMTLSTEVYYGDIDFNVYVNDITQPILISFVDCSGNQQDTLLYLSGSTALVYNDDFCPQPDPCPAVLFTATYDAGTNTFYLALDSTIQFNGVNFWWTFGDGDSSNVQFPSHTYTTNALYSVCLGVLDMQGNFCSYCHTIGFDSLGNVVLRTDAGFHLVVLPFGTSVENPKELPGLSFDIFPQPTGDHGRVHIHSDTDKQIELSIFNVLGQKLSSKAVTVKPGENTTDLSLKDLPHGSYVMTLKHNDVISGLRFIK